MMHQPTLFAPPPFPALGLRNAVLQSICEQSGVTIGQLVGPSRRGELPRLRWGAMVAFDHAGFSLNQIGRLLGNRDHTTVIHGLVQADRHRLITPGFDQFCRSLIAIVDGWRGPE